MTAHEFFDLVETMREKQKAYFRLRCTDNLNAAKKVEKEVVVTIEERLYNHRDRPGLRPLGGRGA